MRALSAGLFSCLFAVFLLAPWSGVQANVLDEELAKGVADLEQGRLEEAEHSLRESLDREATNVFAMNQLGLCLLRQGRFEAASVLFSRVLTREKGNTFAQLWLGAMHLRDARAAEARELFEAVLAVEPRNADANYFLGVICASEGRADDALRRFRLAGEHAKNDSSLLCRLARAYLKRDMVAEAAAAYEAVLSHSPEHGQALMGLGWLRYNEGRAVEGMELMRRALHVPESAEEARKSLAVAANALAIESCAGGDARQAREYWNEALSHDPGNRAARYHLRTAAAGSGACKAVGGLAP